MSVPGILDCTGNRNSRPFILAGVTQNEEGPQYGGLFLDNITSPRTRFNFAYPNLYLITESGNYLLTHGHYLEKYWSYTGELLMEIAQEDLQLGDEYDLRELVGVNFPLNQLACTGVGMAGPLSRIARKVQREVKDKNLARVEKYLERLQKKLDKETNFPWYEVYKELITDKIFKEIKNSILDDLKKKQETRFSAEFVNNPEVHARFKRFYSSSLVEIDRLEFEEGIHIDPPTRVIFGHTHQPILLEEPRPPIARPFGETQSKPIYLYNTGGWLKKRDVSAQETFPGAGVFTLNGDNKLVSQEIS